MIPSDKRGGAGRFLCRLAALGLVLVALGPPVNDLVRFGALVGAAILIFSAAVRPRLPNWFGAVAVAASVLLLQHLWPSPRIEEGHNVFLAGEPGLALVQQLPAEAHDFMAERFEARYPMAGRCNPAPECWQRFPGPPRAFAFSADGLLDRPDYSRRVSGLAFDDATWLRLGFINEGAYNWYSGIGSLQRVSRNRGLHGVLHPWRLDMPYFVMLRFPSAYVGSRLCWRGEILWEEAAGHFVRQPDGPAPACRTITDDDVGQRIFGVSIAEGKPLAMNLSPVWSVRAWQAVDLALPLAAALAIVLLLARWRWRALRLPLILVGLAIVVVVLNDASMIGGVRPFDGGDDGIFYESVGRRIAQHLADGEIALALRGGEDVFYYGGPGLRYFIAAERFLFGDTHFGYLALLLSLPVLVFALFRRLFSLRAALMLALVFVAVPVGGLFGTTFFQYAKWAARGFADPAAYILFIAGLLVLAGRRSPLDLRFWPAFGAGLLFALALWMRPIVAPAAAVLLAGVGLAALANGRWRMLSGLCLGFAPVFGMTLHNWVFGGVFVLFSSNAGHPQVFVTPPSVYLAMLRDWAMLDLASDNALRVLRQLADWLTGPSESHAAVPLHALAVAVLVRVALFGRGMDGFVRLVAGAALAQHLVGMTHVPTARYYYIAWFLTLLVVLVWLRDEGWPSIRKRWPASAMRAEERARRILVPLSQRWMAWAGLGDAAHARSA